MSAFKIDFLDHVAIRVRDLDHSAEWYERILGLKKYKLEAWGEFPVFMLSGKSGIALFPANSRQEAIKLKSRDIRIDHFAINVTMADFLKAQEHFNSEGIDFEFQDHHYFHSIYLSDPDGHTVELTTLMTDPSEFYRND